MMVNTVMSYPDDTFNEDSPSDGEDYDTDIIKYMRKGTGQDHAISDWMYLWLIKPINLGRPFETALQAVQYVQDITHDLNRRDLHAWCRQNGLCKLSFNQLKTYLQLLVLQINGELDIDYTLANMPTAFRGDSQNWFITLVRAHYESHEYVSGQWIIREGTCIFDDTVCYITCAHDGRDMHSPTRQADVQQPMVYQLGNWMRLLDANSEANQSEQEAIHVDPQITSEPSKLTFQQKKAMFEKDKVPYQHRLYQPVRSDVAIKAGGAKLEVVPSVILPHLNGSCTPTVQTNSRPPDRSKNHFYHLLTVLNAGTD